MCLLLPQRGVGSKDLVDEPRAVRARDERSIPSEHLLHGERLTFEVVRIRPPAHRLFGGDIHDDERADRDEDE